MMKKEITAGERPFFLLSGIEKNRLKYQVDSIFNSLSFPGFP